MGLERVGVDDGGDGVGGVVEAVDELEAERDEERDAEQDEGEDGGGVDDGEIDGEAAADVDDPPMSTMMAKPMMPHLPKVEVSNLESRREPAGSARAATTGSVEMGEGAVDMEVAFGVLAECC